MTSVSRGVDIPQKVSTSPTLKQVYFKFEQSKNQITSFTPLQITANKDNFKISKNFITQYEHGTDGERGTQLFIKGYRITAGCIIVNKKTQRVMLITYGSGHHYHFPKGGVENDEIRYKHGDTANYENIPGVEYAFMESALRETWEEAGVKGRIVKDLGKYYYYNGSVITSKVHEWVNKKHGKFPKSIEYYYEMEVDEVCDSWPDGDLRPRKWFTLSECLDELVSNGRFAQFKAVLESSLVGDKEDVYRKQFARDQLAWESKQEYWPRMYNNRYRKVSEECSGAEVYVSIVVYNEKGEINISSGEYGIGVDKVQIEHEPFTWRSSKRFGSGLKYGKMIGIKGYESRKGVKSGVFDMGKYSKCVHVYSAMMSGGGKSMTVEQWKEKYEDGREIFKILSEAVDSGRVEQWTEMGRSERDVMQCEIDRLKGELTKTKNDLVAVNVRLCKRNNTSAKHEYHMQWNGVERSVETISSHR